MVGVAPRVDVRDPGPFTVPKRIGAVRRIGDVARISLVEAVVSFDWTWCGSRRLIIAGVAGMTASLWASVLCQPTVDGRSGTSACTACFLGRLSNSGDGSRQTTRPA